MDALEGEALGVAETGTMSPVGKATAKPMLIDDTSSIASPAQRAFTAGNSPRARAQAWTTMSLYEGLKPLEAPRNLTAFDMSSSTVT